MNGAWDAAHGTLTEPVLYGETSYRTCARLFYDCATVEDWGCGGGGFRQFRPDGYVGVDGSDTPFADVTADLVDYRSDVEGILLRHVLEHNHRWAGILANALESFTRRVVVVIFTPPADETTVMRIEPDYGDVPTIAFRVDDLVAVVEAAGYEARVWTVESDDTAYGVETFVVVDGVES